ncbi:MAG: SDR family oxidoreductase [Micromonosporaceae bacterium]
MSQLLADRVVVVSGVGPGLGRSVALRSAQQGADVVLAARTQATLDKVAEEVTALGRKALAVQTDINDPEAVQRLAQQAVEHFGHVDVLVHNAIAIPPLVDLADADLDAVRAGFETNAIAVLRLTRLLIPALVESKGSIVMVNSMVLRHSQRTLGAYKAVKASLLALAQTLATELGPQGVRVNSVAPGHIWADTLRWYFGKLAKRRGVPPEQVYDETAANTDLGRLPEPDEIADAIVFLASDMARAITGQCLDVNCGEYHH